jgi:mono/diheme cytochrome c family protein
MKINIRTATSLVAGALGLSVSLSLAAQPPTIERKPPLPLLSIEGKDSYASYCAACHGKDGKGDGPAAPALKQRVPDLTTIAKRHNGNFDTVAVSRVITGADKPYTAHGSEEMPIWGPIFRDLQTDHAAMLRVTNLADYLKTIQQK